MVCVLGDLCDSLLDLYALLTFPAKEEIVPVNVNDMLLYIYFILYIYDTYF